MALQQNFLEIGKGKLTQAKAFLEELEVQLALGKAEARDTFKEEKKNLSSFLNQQKANLKKAGQIADENKLELLKTFEDLEAVLGKDIPSNKRKFDQQKKETLAKIYELEYNLREAYGDVSTALQKQLDEFKVKLDAFRVHLALGSFEDEAVLIKRKNELQQTVDALRLKLQEEAVAGDRMEHFMEEISESFDHMKKAFSDLFV
nr:hypothetical protein [uncultured bacterium]